MDDQSLLSQLAQLTGAFVTAGNTTSQQLHDFQTNIATALLQKQPVSQFQQSFQFEQIENFNTQHLTATDLQQLQNVVQNAKSSSLKDKLVRVFKRDVSLISSQIKGSIPDWARGAKVDQTIGPIANKTGQQSWLDIYTIIPGVQLSLQGSSQPSMILSVEQARIIFIFKSHTDYTIPQSSLWINAHLISSSAPDDQYCGLTVKSGKIHFTNDVELNDAKMIVPPGTTVTVTLELMQQTDTSVSPDNAGIDAKNAVINLPQTFSFTFSDTGSQLTSAGDASWTLYHQQNNFTFDNTKPSFYLPQLNRVCIPFKSSIAQFNPVNSLSSLFNINETANVVQSGWGLSCATLDINNPLEAKGIGAMLLQTDKGLMASWDGLLDVNLKNKEWISLRSPWILCEPGRINISDANAGNINAKQQYKLWKNNNGQWNFIDLNYTDSFYFFYNCMQAGNETVGATTNCIGTIDKPVDVAAKPFALNSKQTVFLLGWSQNLFSVLLLDDNLLADNSVPIPSGEIIFKPEALALNNALLTVSPLKGFVLGGELKNNQEFSKAVMIDTFGLVGYLPALPDPYAADVDIFKRAYGLHSNDTNNAGINMNAINKLLVCIMSWNDDTQPALNFSWGDLPAQTDPAIQQSPDVLPVKVSLNLTNNQNLAAQYSQAKVLRQSQILTNQYKAAGITYQAQNSNPSTYNRSNKFLQNSLFSLLDVSTNADLLGINIGFINDRLFFQTTYDVVPVTGTTTNTDSTNNPLAIQGMDVVATSHFVRIFTTPQISWEPLLNITAPFNPTNDPPYGILKFDDDGTPALIGNNGLDTVPLAPLPVTNAVVKNYNTDTNFKAWSLVTLPNGLISVCVYDQDNYYVKPHPNTSGATIELIKASFNDDVQAGLQIVTKSGYNINEDNHVFKGLTQQMFNAKSLFQSGTWSILGSTVTAIFNNEFGNNDIIDRGVPLERYDFTGYGANVFSNWLNKQAEIASVSKTIFEVWKGRTSQEVIQVRTILYPWAVKVVRTITMYRSSNGFEYRVDSGWRADSNGEYDFKNQFPERDSTGAPVLDADGNILYQTVPGDTQYTFHPGLVRGVYNVRNIAENNLAPYTNEWFKNTGAYVNEDDGLAYDVHDPTHPLTAPLSVDLRPVYFDADVLITDVDGSKNAATGDFITSKKMLGYIQIAPKGIIISQEDFSDLLDLQNGLGGPVNCLLNINGSNQKMRISRVEVNHSIDESGNIVFVSAAKGMPVLPKDGSWSIVLHDKPSTEVRPITDTVVSLIRKGVFTTADDVNNTFAKEITQASELFKAPADRLTQLAFLQNTDTQKILYRNPYFNAGEQLLQSTLPDYADAYKLLNSNGIFPNINNLVSIDLDKAGCAIKIIDEGYQLVDKAATNVLKTLEQPYDAIAGDASSFTFINNPGILKVYVEYGNTPAVKDPSTPIDPSDLGNLKFDLNSQANNWLNKMKNMTMVIDLATFERIFLIQGKFDTEKGYAPQFNGNDPSDPDPDDSTVGPKLIPGKDLEPIVDILQVLEDISTSDYKDIAKKGLQIAMSNSPNNWEYKFQADKEIPVIQFPPAYADGPTTPMRLEAGLKLGVYFNLATPVPPTGLPAMSAGGFVEFDGKLSVMCVSLAVATIYAIGQVSLKISADTITGPGLYMKLGCGIELMVGIPVVGNVSVYYAVGVEISLDKTQITVAAFLLYQGRAELAGGLVTITIQIEASGKIHKTNSPGRTDVIAQMTFSIDVSVAFVIDINETEKWQEERQIA